MSIGLPGSATLLVTSSADNGGNGQVLSVKVRVDEKNEYREDAILRIGHADAVDSGVIEKELTAAIKNVFK